MTQENLISVVENKVVENSSKEKVNKVSAKKAKAQSKANNSLYKDMLVNLKKSNDKNTIYTKVAFISLSVLQR